VRVQADAECSLRLEYAPLDRPAELRRSDELRTSAEDLHSARLVARGLEPGPRYSCRVLVDGQPAKPAANLVLQTAPLPSPSWEGELRVALLCGHDPQTGEGGIFAHISTAKPDLVLWLGDNCGAGAGDWDSLGDRLAAPREARLTPGLAPLLGGAGHLAVWSAADHGPPGSGALLWNAPVARRAFDLSWANPEGAATAAPDDFFSVVQWGDAAFYLVDVQSQRMEGGPGEARRILGDAQATRLREALRLSHARLNCVVLGNPLVDPVPAPGRFAAFPEERQRLLEMLSRCGAPGLLVVSGQPDGPGELSVYSETGRPELHDLTVGPVTAAPLDVKDGLNYLREPGTRVAARHFALLTLAGTREARSVRLSVIDAQGRELWSKRLPLSNKPASQ